MCLAPLRGPSKEEPWRWGRSCRLALDDASSTALLIEHTPHKARHADLQRRHCACGQEVDQGGQTIRRPKAGPVAGNGLGDRKPGREPVPHAHPSLWRWALLSQANRSARGRKTRHIAASTRVSSNGPRPMPAGQRIQLDTRATPFSDPTPIFFDPNAPKLSIGCVRRSTLQGALWTEGDLRRRTAILSRTALSQARSASTSYAEASSRLVPQHRSQSGTPNTGTARPLPTGRRRPNVLPTLPC